MTVLADLDSKVDTLVTKVVRLECVTHPEIEVEIEDLKAKLADLELENKPE